MLFSSPVTFQHLLHAFWQNKIILLPTGFPFHALNVNRKLPVFINDVPVFLFCLKKKKKTLLVDMCFCFFVNEFTFPIDLHIVA